MEYYLSYFISALVLDFSVLYIICRLFSLRIGKCEFLMLGLFNSIPQLIFVFCEPWFGFYFLMKLGFYLFTSIFICDKFNVKRILIIFASSIGLMFSVFGFGYMFVLYIRAIFSTLFKRQMKVFYDCIVVIGLVFYIFMLIKLTDFLSKKRKINTFLAKVSFSLFGRHIEITGLIDSGNSLCDTKTKKPVIVVPLAVLAKYLTESECNMIKSENYFGLNISHELEYVSVGGAKGRMPISDIGEIKLSRNGKEESFDCVLGIVCENLTEDKDYDCLLHRDFL